MKKRDLLATIRSLKLPDNTNQGNCGTFALALSSYLTEKSVTHQICVLTSAKDERELQQGEPDVYHVFVEVKLQEGAFDIDSDGVLTDHAIQEYLEFYNVSTAQLLICADAQAIRNNTNWDIPESEFLTAFHDSQT